MPLSPDRQLRFSVCAFKAGIPAVFYDACTVIVAAPCDSCDIEEFFSNYGNSGVSLLLSAEKVNFCTDALNKQSIKVALKKPEEVTLSKESLVKRSEIAPANDKEDLLILLAKMAELLPEVLIAELHFQDSDAMHKYAFSRGLQAIDLDAVVEGLSQQGISRISEARICIRDDVDSSMVCYRSLLKEHYAIIIGKPLEAQEPLVRVHSSCYTGDLLGSLSCDCRDQLHDSVVRMIEDPIGGIILYLSQEGRGIGLPNKIRAYNLQEKGGLDTVEANFALGFRDDERDFKIAKLMLEDLGVQKLRLITNNPRKIQQLRSAGINITTRVPISMRSNPHNSKYLQTKSERLGHIFTA